MNKVRKRQCQFIRRQLSTPHDMLSSLLITSFIKTTRNAHQENPALYKLPVFLEILSRAVPICRVYLLQHPGTSKVT